MLLFYKQTVENTRKVPQSLFDEKLKGIGQEMSGKAPHLVKQNASLQIYRKHVAALRGGKLALLSSDALRKDILSLIAQGEMIHKRRGKNSPSSSILLRTYRFHSPFPAFFVSLGRP